MTVAGGWILAPLVFAMVCVGIGLLVQAGLRERVPGALVPGLGLAGMIVLAGLLTIGSWSAPLAAPACAVAAVAGYIVARPWHRPGAWTLACGVLAFVIVSAPSWLSGQFSVLGFTKLDDTAIWAGITDHLMSHGQGVGSLPPSSYQLTLKQWLGDDYPVGTFTPLGVVSRLTGQDPLNAYQPLIGCYVAVCASGLSVCVRELAGSPRRAAVCALIAVQASLFFGYAAWGSIKEICVGALLVTLAATRRLHAAGLVAAAAVCAFGVGAAVLVGPALLGLIALARPRAREAIAGAAVLAVGSVPVLIHISRGIEVTLHGAPSVQSELGNLLGPLGRLQGAGLWPAGDFRVPPDPRWPATVLAVLCLAAAVAGMVVAVRRRAWSVPLLLATAGIGCSVAIARGAPWIDAKALAISSVLVLAGATAGVASARRGVAAAGLLVLAAGAAVSTWLIYRDVKVAPRSTLAQQRNLGRALRGHGPTLALTVEPLAIKYLFAPARVEGARDARAHLVPDRDGDAGRDYTDVEMEAVDPKALADYNAILRRRSPLGSWAQSDFQPYAGTRGYESWIRIPGAPAPLGDLPLSTSDNLAPGVVLPAAAPDCEAVRQLAATLGTRTLAFTPRANPVVGDLSTAKVPPGWQRTEGLRPDTDGTASLPFTLPAAGPWRVWVQGETLGRLSARVDGHPVGSFRHEVTAVGAWLRFDSRQLAAGPHTLEVSYQGGAFWRAGRGAPADRVPLGLVAFSPEVPQRVEAVAVDDAGSLCDGRTFDWIEALP